MPIPEEVSSFPLHVRPVHVHRQLRPNEIRRIENFALKKKNRNSAQTSNEKTYSTEIKFCLYNSCSLVFLPEYETEFNFQRYFLGIQIRIRTENLTVSIPT